MGSNVVSDKPVAWIRVAVDARRGDGTPAELATVPGYVQARVLPQACIHVPLDRNAVDAHGLIADETTAHAVTGAIAAVLAAGPAGRSRSSSAPPAATAPSASAPAPRPSPAEDPKPADLRDALAMIN